MIESGIFHYRCQQCLIEDTYNDLPITLQVDHIDGDTLNNEVSNLRFLCPNCHSQTINYGSKNRANKKVRGRTRAEFWEIRNGELYENNRTLIEMVKSSGIDFGKWGWSGKVATIIEKHPQKVATWMRRYMPDFYDEFCYKRKTPA